MTFLGSRSFIDVICVGSVPVSGGGGATIDEVISDKASDFNEVADSVLINAGGDNTRRSGAGFEVPFVLNCAWTLPPRTSPKGGTSSLAARLDLDFLGDEDREDFSLFTAGIDGLRLLLDVSGASSTIAFSIPTGPRTSRSRSQSIPMPS